MLVNAAGVANLIRENKTFRINSTIQTGQKHGMQLLDDALFRLWKEDVVERDELLAKANDPGELAARIAKAERGAFEDVEDVGVNA